MQSPQDKAKAVFAEIGVGDEETLTFDETEARNAIYDRQIRLWGADAQRSIGSSKALLCGMGGLNAEIAKNLVLAGITCTLQDDARVRGRDLGANLLLEEQDVGRSRAECCAERAGQLNEFVTVDSETRALSELDFAAIAKKYSIVCLERAPGSSGSDDDYASLNAAVRAKKGLFFYLYCGADGGLIFADLGDEHAYRVETGSGDTLKVSEPMLAKHCSFAAMRSAPFSACATKWSQAPALFVCERLDALWRVPPEEKDGSSKKRGRDDGDDDDDLAGFLAFAKNKLANGGDAKSVDEEQLTRWHSVRGAQLAHVCAVLGGLAGLEVVKAVSKKGAPIDNVLVYDVDASSASVVRASPVAKASVVTKAPIIPDDEIL